MRTANIVLSIVMVVAALVPIAASTGNAAAQKMEEFTLAYVSRDYNIWVQAFPEGEPIQVTTDNPEGLRRHYFDPRWSPDGSKLVFWSDGPQGITLLHYWDGSTVHDIPGTSLCKNARFGPDSERIYFTCAMFIDHNNATPPDTAEDPRYAVVTSSLLDGSEMQPVVAYTTEGTLGIPWSPGGSRLKEAILTDVDPVTGNLLVSGYETGPFGWTVFEPNGTRVFDGLYGVIGKDGPFNAVYTSERDTHLVSWCEKNCVVGSKQDAQFMVAKVNLDGTILYEYRELAGTFIFGGYSALPDIDSVVISARVEASTPPYLIVVTPGEELVVVGIGSYPAVKP